MNAKEKRETKKRLKRLLGQLHGFKTKESFIVFGFGIGGVHNEWLVEIESIKTGMARLIQQLGYEYVTSHGKETELSKLIKEKIKEFK